MRALAGACALLVALLFSATADARKVTVVVPTKNNLQLMAFWVAQGNGYFAEEGIELELRVPEVPQATAEAVRTWGAEAFLLPPPVYLDLIADRHPIVLVANLLRNDPINLIVAKRVAEERGIKRDGPIADRLRAIRGLRIGVAPHPPRRLRALFAAYGMDADKDVKMVILHGREQNDAFTRGEVDALYAHTPYLERALIHDEAVMVIHQSAGEVPALADRQIHALAVTKTLATNEPDTVMRLVRSVARAQSLIHADRGAAVSALRKAFPNAKEAELARIVDIYEPAVPDSTLVTEKATRRAVDQYPAGRDPPDLSRIDVSAHVSDRFVTRATSPAAATASPPGSSRGRIVAIGAALLLALAIGVTLWRRKKNGAR